MPLRRADRLFDILRILRSAAGPLAAAIADQLEVYPLSPRIWLLQAILAKCGEVGGLPPELAARLRRNAPPPQPDHRPPRSAIRGGHRAWR